MKSRSRLPLADSPRSHWAQRRSLILGSSLLLLAAVLTWQASARFVASANLNSPTISTIEATTTETVITAIPGGGGGCNNCCGTWSQKTNAAPAARDIHAMAYAQQCNRVVMFGGRTAGGVPPANVTDETWEWDGNAMTWAQFTPATRPAARGQHAMAYDAARNEVVLFGGYNSSFGGLNDTWVYSCATHTWTQKFPASSPSARHRHAMAYDPNSQLVVLYGGGSSFQDTWTWDGTNWVEIVGANQPGIRTEHAMAFDGTRVILFGGSKNAGFADNDTWDLTLTSPSAGIWTMVAANGTGPNKRQRHAMAYAPNCQKVTLFGGSTDITSYVNDTWEWSRASLSWCQTSVASPPSPGREYPAMAYDGKGVLMYGGLNSSTAQLGDAWRFACSGPYTKRAGKMDNFNLPTDSTSPTAAFAANVNSVYSTPPKMDFDEPTTNKFLIHSFTGLPTNIVRAELEVRANPEPGGSNDSIHLDFPPFNAPAFTWGKNFFALHPGGTWDPGQGAYTFILDLCNLPAGGVGQPTNLIGLLNANQSLHVMIQDDTKVDYIKLRVWTCPPKKHFAGLPHEALGQAQLSEDSNGSLVVSNLGASGQDGVNIALGNAEGWEVGFAPSGTMPNGVDIRKTFTGTVNGEPDQLVGTFRKQIINNLVEQSVDFSSVGANTHSIAIYNAGVLVASVGGHQGTTTYAREGDVVFSRYRMTKGGSMLCFQSFAEALSIQITGVGTYVGDYLITSPDIQTAQIEALTAVKLQASGISSIAVATESLHALARRWDVLGTATLEPFIGGNMAVAGIGSSSEDGVSISLGQSQGFSISLDDIDPMGAAPGGATLQISTSHILNALPPPPPRTDIVNVARWIIAGIPIYGITSDFSGLGATSSRVVAFSGNTQVADVTNFNGMVVSSAWPTGFSHNGTSTLGYELIFPPSTSISFNPCPPAPCDPLGNITSLRILPQNPNVTVSHLTETRLTATDLSEFTITEATMVPFCPNPITVSPGSLPVAGLNQAYNQQVTVSGGRAPYQFSISSGALNAGLSLDTRTGRITGTPTSLGSAKFDVTATDDNGCTGVQSYTIDVIVVCPTITVNPATAFGGIVGTSYNLTFTASGGTGPYSFARVSGTLPPGLILAPMGALTGTPTMAGVFNFTVEATDVAGCTGTKVYSLTINSGCAGVTIVVNPTTSPNGFVGTAYSQTFTATGGTGPYTFTRVNGTLPPGLTLATGGALTGTPITQGTFTFTVQAADINGCTGTRDYTVTISGNGLMFYPLDTPVRALETRPGVSEGCVRPGAPIAAGTTLTLGVQTACTGIPANARAMMGNVTVVPGNTGGYLTLFPSNATQPIVANSNFKPFEITNNVFTVGLGAADGAFKIFASSTTHVIVDITGYFAPPSPTGLYFHILNEPVRLVETRTPPGLPGCIKPGAPFPFGTTAVQGRSPVAAPCNVIPVTARAMMGNVTVVNPATSGYLTIWPSGVIQPTVAASNFAGADIINAPFLVKLGADGKFNVFTTVETHLVIDILGYFSTEAVDENGAGLLFTILPKPIRELETRPDGPGFSLPGCFRPNAPIQGGVGGVRTQSIWGTCEGVNIPTVARAMMGNVTVVNVADSGYLTHYPGNVGTPPTIATSNYPTPVIFGYNRHFTVGLSPTDGTFKILTSATTDLIVDVSGYFAP